MMLILFILFFIGANSFHIHKKIANKRLYGNSPKFWDVLSDNLKQSARNWFIQRAERTGIDWNAITNRYQKDLDKLEDIYNIKKNS